VNAYLASLIGGMLIGLSVGLLFLLNGRIAGCSGIVANLFQRSGGGHLTNGAFLFGLLIGPPIYRLAVGAWPIVQVDRTLPVLALAGLLVGFGTRLGSGCTSGHGVAGVARLSPRSIVAVMTFLVAAMATVFLMRLMGVG
jgi:uncharacterized membrane protein YedE/YeeE